MWVPTVFQASSVTLGLLSTLTEVQLPHPKSEETDCALGRDYLILKYGKLFRRAGEQYSRRRWPEWGLWRQVRLDLQPSKLCNIP